VKLKRSQNRYGILSISVLTLAARQLWFTATIELSSGMVRLEVRRFSPYRFSKI